ncbi:unnamed protein product, partial [Tilletia caries]
TTNVRQQLRRYIEVLGRGNILPNVRGVRTTISYEDLQRILLFTTDPRQSTTGGFVVRMAKTIFFLAQFTMGVRIGDLVKTKHDDRFWRWGDVELWLSGWDDEGPTFEMWATGNLLLGVLDADQVNDCFDVKKAKALISKAEGGRVRINLAAPEAANAPVLAMLNREKKAVDKTLTAEQR